MSISLDVSRRKLLEKKRDMPGILAGGYEHQILDKGGDFLASFFSFTHQALKEGDANERHHILEAVQRAVHAILPESRPSLSIRASEDPEEDALVIIHLAEAGHS